MKIYRVRDELSTEDIVADLVADIVVMVERDVGGKTLAFFLF
jgi:hypothetical protein